MSWSARIPTPCSTAACDGGDLCVTEPCCDGGPGCVQGQAAACVTNPCTGVSQHWHAGVQQWNLHRHLLPPRLRRRNLRLRPLRLHPQLSTQLLWPGRRLRPHLPILVQRRDLYPPGRRRHRLLRGHLRAGRLQRYQRLRGDLFLPGRRGLLLSKPVLHPSMSPGRLWRLQRLRRDLQLSPGGRRSVLPEPVLLPLLCRQAVRGQRGLRRHLPWVWGGGDLYRRQSR